MKEAVPYKIQKSLHQAKKLTNVIFWSFEVKCFRYITVENNRTQYDRREEKRREEKRREENGIEGGGFRPP
jgi:hypothetical protein